MSHLVARTVVAVGCAGLTILRVTGAEVAPATPEPARFIVHAGDSDRTSTPVCASLEGLPANRPGQELALREIVDGASVPTPSQVVAGAPPQLCWILTGTTEAGAQRTYELTMSAMNAAAERASPAVSLVDDGAALTVRRERKPVLAYRYAPIPAPPDTSPLYERGGFIHPLWSPAGEVLTRIQPPDHYHHVGIWNPWTHTEFEGREIDFWNLKDGQGTVRSRGVLSRISGDVAGGFSAWHEHVDLNAPDPSGAKVAVNEEWNVRVWNVGNDAWLIDFVSTLSCATESPLTIKAYRYQGFGFRATAKWGDETATLLTSEGKDKSNGNATRARWCDVRGVSDEGTAGILFMASPSNRDFPELLRIWPTGMNEGRENVFVNFNPAQEHDWVLEPDHTYTQRYRMWVYDGAVTPVQAESLWKDLADPPVVTGH